MRHGSKRRTSSRSGKVGFGLKPQLPLTCCRVFMCVVISPAAAGFAVLSATLFVNLNCIYAPSSLD